MDHDQQVKANNKGPKACATCAKAKSRCIPGPRDGICERCDRLNKPCSAQTPAPPRKRKAPKPTRVAELEKRLEDLSARVESRQQAQAQGRTPTPSEGDSPAAAAAISAENSSSNLTRAAKRQRRSPWELGPPQPAFGYIFGGEESGEESPTHGEDGRGGASASAASRHRPSHSPVLSHKTPGVATPALWDGGDKASRTSPTYLGRHNWSGSLPQAVGAGASPCVLGGPKSGPEWPRGEEADKRLAEYREHMEHIFPFIVIPRHMNSEQLRKERPYLWKAVMMQTLCLDASRQVPLGNELLNDIVTSCFLQPKKSFDVLQALEILVAWWHVKLQSFQITNLLYLMRSMCVSLGFSESQEAMNNQEHDSTSLEQKRAFTGVYYLVTMIFTTNKKPDAFMNTTYLESCCRLIEEKMEYPTDEFIVYLVRTQQLSQSISMTLAFRNASLPLSMIIKSFQEQIAQLRASIPESVKKHAAIKTQLHIAEILLYEAGIHDDLSASLPVTERLELLWECLKATRSMLEARFEIPIVERPRQTCLSSFDYTYAMLTSLRLSTLALPGWDLAVVRRELDADKFLGVQIAEVRWMLEKRSGGAWRAGKEEEHDDKTGPGRARLDPLETLYTRLLQLRIPLRAELLAAAERENKGEPTTTGGGGREVLEQVAADSAAPVGEDQQLAAAADAALLDFTQDPEGPFWQDMYRVSEWENNFSSLFGWGEDDQSVPVYAAPGPRLEGVEAVAGQIPVAPRS